MSLVQRCVYLYIFVVITEHCAYVIWHQLRIVLVTVKLHRRLICSSLISVFSLSSHAVSWLTFSDTWTHADWVVWSSRGAVARCGRHITNATALISCRHVIQTRPGTPCFTLVYTNQPSRGGSYTPTNPPLTSIVPSPWPVLLKTQYKFVPRFDQNWDFLLKPRYNWSIYAYFSWCHYTINTFMISSWTLSPIVYDKTIHLEF